MVDVLEETTGDTLSQEHVLHRLTDWEHRINSLYHQVEDWLPIGWTAVSTRHSSMLANVMRQVGVPPRRLPILDLLRDGELAAAIEPRGLWIVGTNGRLDLRGSRLHYVIFDIAQNFEPPAWYYAPIANRMEPKPFETSSLRLILAA